MIKDPQAAIATFPLNDKDVEAQGLALAIPDAIVWSPRENHPLSVEGNRAEIIAPLALDIQRLRTFDVWRGSRIGVENNRVNNPTSTGLK